MPPELPWHVIVVHVPLGGAVLLPVVSAVLVAFPREERRTWAVAFVLQTLVLIGCLVASATGERQGLAVQFLVDADAIEAHETAAQVFLAATVATWIALGVGLSRRAMPRRRSVAAAAVVLGLVAAALGARAGHLGGELVFQQGAVRAHEQAGQAADP